MKMKAEEFLKKISGETTLIFHNDGDGVCSGTLVYNYLRSKKIRVKLFSGDIEKSTFERADVSKNNIIVDLPVDQYLELLEKFKGKKLLVIDHHPPKNDLNEIGFIHVNPRFKKPDVYISAAEVCYKILKKISKPQRWIMRIGGVSDCSLKGTKKEKLASHMIESVKAVKRTIYLPELVEHLSACKDADDFLKNKEFKEAHAEFEGELNKILGEFDSQKHGDVIFFKLKSRYPMKSVVSNVLFERYPNKTIFVYKEYQGMYKISARSNKVNLSELMKEASKGIGNGGGHPKAAAATVSDLETFKERVMKIIEGYI